MLFFKRFLAVAAILLPLTSCTLKDDCLLVDLFVPNHFYVPDTFDGKRTDFLAWWDSFADKHLKGLFDMAVLNNHDLTLARERLREVCYKYGMNQKEAEDQVIKANIQFFPPRAGPDDMNNLDKGKFTGLGGNAIEKTTVDKANFHFRLFSASFEIDLFGRKKHGLEAAKNEIESIGEVGKDILGLLRSQITKHYIVLRTHQNQHKLMNQFFATQVKFIDKLKNRIEAGLNTTEQLLDVRDQIGWMQKLIYEAESGINLALHSLAHLIGINNVEKLRELLEEVVEIPKVDPNIFAGTPSEMLKNRPDIREKLSLVKHFCALMGLSLADQFPRFTIDLSFTLSSKVISQIFNPEGFEYDWGIGADQNWYTRWKVWSKILMYRSKFKQAETKYHKAISAALTEVGDGMVLFLRAIQDLDLCSKLTEETRVECRKIEHKLTEQGRALPQAMAIFSKTAKMVHEEFARKGDLALRAVDLARTLGW